MLYSIAAIMCTLVIVVGLHEAGHALIARVFKVEIQSITIGFGRAILRWKMKNGTAFVWALWPLGGAVHLLNTRIEKVPASKHDDCFDKKPVWMRLCILLAGIAANLLFAWFALLLVSQLGIKARPPVIQTVLVPSFANDAGLRAGDQLISLNGDLLSSWQAVGRALIVAKGTASVRIVTKGKDGVQQQRIDLESWKIKPTDRSIFQSLGIVPNTKCAAVLIRSKSFWGSVGNASSELAQSIKFYFILLARIVTGSIPFSLLLGPLAIFNAAAASFLQGVSVFLWFTAQFSIAVAVVNSLPIPGMDGGGMVYALIEKWSGKPVSLALEILLFRLSVIALALVFVNLVMNDVQRYLV